MRQALTGVKTLFLLVSNAPDELTQAINTLGLAREAGVQGIVYQAYTCFKVVDLSTNWPRHTALKETIWTRNLKVNWRS
jgi:hypothetical protein